MKVTTHSTTGPAFQYNRCYFGELIHPGHPVLSIHSRTMCTRLYKSESPSLQADMAQPHRDAPIIHSPHAGQRRTARSQVHKKRALFFSPCLWFVNTSVSVQQLPGLYLITIKHLHEKVDKGWNSGGGLATKRPIYSVQSERDTEREEDEEEEKLGGELN